MNAFAPDRYPNHILLYLADPMCSWSWGFAPVAEQLWAAYKGRVRLRLVMGGLRAGNTEPMDAAGRDLILHHWRQVQERTGQDFNFAFNMGAKFVYDSEPACRAVLAMEQLDPGNSVAHLKAVQKAFYLDNRDVTKAAVLADVAESVGLDRKAFLTLLGNEDMTADALKDFLLARALGVFAYPTVLGRVGDRPIGPATQGEVTMLTHGYMTYPELAEHIEAWLAGSPIHFQG